MSLISQPLFIHKENPPHPGEEFYTDLPVGEILRRARVLAGLSIQECEQLLHIRASYLEAMEQSDFDALPGRVYVIGFVRTYAEFLNLDGGRVVDLLKRQPRDLGAEQALNIHLLPSDTRLPTVSVMIAAFAGILIALLLWIGYQNTHLGGVHTVPPVTDELKTMTSLEQLARVNDTLPVKKETISSADNPATVTSEPEQMGPPVPPDFQKKKESAVVSVPVSIRVIDNTWIELKSGDGRVVEAREFRVGEHIDVAEPVDEFGNAYRLTVGNAAGVDVYVGEEKIPSLGGKNKIRRNVTLNPKMLLIKPE